MPKPSPDGAHDGRSFGASSSTRPTFAPWCTTLRDHLVHSRERVAGTFRASFRPARSKRDLPLMPAIETLETPQTGHSDVTTLNTYRHALNQCLCYFLSRRGYDPSEGLT